MKINTKKTIQITASGANIIQAPKEGDSVQKSLILFVFHDTLIH